MWKFDENVFQKNLETFGRGSLREILVRPDRNRERWEILSSKEGSPTLLWDNTSLHSRYDPVTEGERWADAAMASFDNPSQGFLVMGLGLGYHLFSLLERFQGQVVLFEPIPDILRASFRLFPWYLFSDRLSFFTDPSGTRGLSRGYAVLSHAPSEKLRPDLYRSVRKIYEGGGVSLELPAPGPRHFTPLRRILPHCPLGLSLPDPNGTPGQLLRCRRL